jgi:hypothetical protein
MFSWYVLINKRFENNLQNRKPDNLFIIKKES